MCASSSVSESDRGRMDAAVGGPVDGGWPAGPQESGLLRPFTDRPEL